MFPDLKKWREGSFDGPEENWRNRKIQGAGKKWALMQQEMYIFSSFFYTKLREDLFDEIDRWGLRMTGFDIFEKRFLFVPLNESLHWSLAIICNAGKMGLSVEERQKLPYRDQPRIIFFDSLACHRNKKIYTMLLGCGGAANRRVSASRCQPVLTAPYHSPPPHVFEGTSRENGRRKRNINSSKRRRLHVMPRHQTRAAMAAQKATRRPKTSRWKSLLKASAK